jgi:hypothetical protein
VFNRILVPADLTERNREAVEMARSLVARDGNICLLHVIETIPGVSVDEEKEDAVAVLNRTQWSKVSIVWTGPDVLRLYRVNGLPTMFVLDRDGNVAAVTSAQDVSAVVESLLKLAND